MRSNKFLMFLLLVVLYTFSCSNGPREQVDVIFTHGQIQTVDDSLRVVEAMAVRDGRIVMTGSNREVQALYSGQVVISLNGKFVYPGFIDPHSHFVGYCTNLLNADLWMSKSMDEIVDRLREHRKTLTGEWLQGRGWDQNLFEIREMPDNSLLNAAFPDVPVYIVRVDGHAAVANDVALRMAGITAATRIAGGEVVVENGRPTGLLIDRAMYLVSSLIPRPTSTELAGLLKKGEKNLFAVGLTSVSDAGLPGSTIKFIDSLQQNGFLDIRLYAMVNPTEENFTEFLPQGPYETDQLTVRSVKLFADGALGSRGALLKKPYSDNPSSIGLLVDSKDLMLRSCELAFQNGFQVITHCIGDSAVSLMLDMYSMFLPEQNDLRWRIEHAQVVSPEDFDKFGRYSIIPSIQAIHAVSDMGWAEDRLGPERIKGAYAYRDLMNQTGWLPNGSDFPVEDINPLFSYHAAFTRTDQKGKPDGGWFPGQKLTREEALRGMTIWAAKANFEENTRGSLEAGKFADFVVLDADLLTIDENSIYDLPVLETWISGKRVH